MRTQDIKRIVRKTGARMSTTSMSSRVRGWCNSWTEGFYFSSVYPWATWYTRGSYRVKAIISCRTQTMTISYTSGKYTHEGYEDRRTSAFEALRKVFYENGVEYSERDGEFTVTVDNPYSEYDVNRSVERYAQVTRLARQRK